MITRDELRKARKAHGEAQASLEQLRIAFQQASARAREAQKSWENIRDQFVLQECSDEDQLSTQHA